MGTVKTHKRVNKNSVSVVRQHVRRHKVTRKLKNGKTITFWRGKDLDNEKMSGIIGKIKAMKAAKTLSKGYGYYPEAKNKMPKKNFYVFNYKDYL
jgi:hypothetical protein